ncbi:hypothetical protein LCGC14_0318170 [marine sediment metagenome]|uniref:dUTP diphosphatase n=1 Tax=marine sediment metagenome TaxID=412755 RepID=A0A0F9WS04_9ZZZZ
MEHPATLQIYLAHEDAQMPTKSNPTDSGFDLYACEGGAIGPMSWGVVPTGIHLGIESGFEVQIRSRSGLAAKQGVFVMNAPGTVDQDYTGEIRVILLNFGTQPFRYKVGDRIAQMVPFKLDKIFLAQVEDKPENESRGDAGFGSTGR